MQAYRNQDRTRTIEDALSTLNFLTILIGALSTAIMTIPALVAARSAAQSKQSSNEIAAANLEILMSSLFIGCASAIFVSSLFKPLLKNAAAVLTEDYGPKLVMSTAFAAGVTIVARTSLRPYVSIFPVTKLTMLACGMITAAVFNTGVCVAAKVAASFRQADAAPQENNAANEHSHGN